MDNLILEKVWEQLSPDHDLNAIITEMNLDVKHDSLRNMLRKKYGFREAFEKTLNPNKKIKVQKEFRDRIKKPKKNLNVDEELKYQKEVLDRMIDRGCKSCEKKRQERHIKRLEDEK